MKLPKGLKITALVLMSLLTAFFLLMGIGEMVGGDLSGFSHLLPAILLMFIMWLGWKKPLWSGILLLTVGIFNTLRFSIGMNNNEELPAALLIMAVPFLGFGLLFLLAGILERNK